MAVRSSIRWWWVGGLVALGLMLVVLGRFLAGQGLEAADRWASVIGVFLNITAVLLAGYTAAGRQAPSTRMRSDPGGITRNTLTDVEADGMVVIGRDIQGPGAADGAGSAGGETESRIEGGTFHGPLIMGRDIRHLPPFPPSQSGGSQ